jgi:RNA polymerase sigma factor (sigma-70 family)
MDRNDHALAAARGVMSPAVRDAMLAAVPRVRAFAISLSGNVDRADDLLQEALLRAIAGIGSFQPGSNMSAWLFAILRNLFYREYQKRRRELEDADGAYVNSLKSAPEQQSRVAFEEFRLALACCRPASRRLCFSSAPRASPATRRPRSASAPRGRSRAGSVAHARASRSCFPSTAPTGSARTTRRAAF